MNVQTSILNLPCGMGKTFISSMLASHYDNVIIISPLRFLAQQTLLMINSLLNYEPILISMDGSLDINIIKTLIKDKNIISVTYDSVEVLLQILNLLHNVYIIIDEFHNLSNNNINNHNDPINKLINSNNNLLYLSATPNLSIKHDKIFKYSWINAIKNSYICDFKIIVPDKDFTLKCFDELLLQISNNVCNKALIKKCFFILKSMLYYGSYKCICYFTSVENIEIFEKILEWMMKFMNIQVDNWIITYKTTLNVRNKTIDEFKKSTNMSLLLSVHILDEGINIEECDSVFITKPNENIENIVQRMSRANRITKDKKECKIYLWCTRKKIDEILEYILDKTEGFTKDRTIKFNPEKIKSEIHVIKQKEIKSEILKELFKKNPNKNNKCIHDFLNISKENYNENVLVVDFDIVVEWLETRKDNLKKILIDNFEKNYDYTIEKITKKKDIGGTFFYKIMLTPNCFKELCMISQTKKAKSIRTYLI